jgi:hypothetical protein
MLVLCFLRVPVYAQPGPPQDDGPRPMQRRGPERMLNHLKNALDVSDQQWTALRPKIEEVMKLRRDLAPIGGPPGMMPMGGGFGRDGGPPPMRGNGPRNDNHDPYGNPPSTQSNHGDQNNSADRSPPQGQQDDHQPPSGPGHANKAPPPPDGEHPPRSEIHDRFDDLQDVLDNKNTKPQELEQKIAAYQAARKQAADKLKKSQDELRQSLTPMQQAVLITAGLMD